MADDREEWGNPLYPEMPIYYSSPAGANFYDTEYPLLLLLRDLPNANSISIDILLMKSTPNTFPNTSIK